MKRGVMARVDKRFKERASRIAGENDESLRELTERLARRLGEVDLKKKDVNPRRRYKWRS